MQIYLLTHGDIGANTMKVNVFFFKRSALAAAERLQSECGDWVAREDRSDRIAYWETRTGSRWMSVSSHYLLFRDWSVKRWIRARCHVQNLNEDRNGKVKGSILRYGRLWLHRAWKPEGKYRDKQIEFCWHIGGGMRWLGAGMTLFDGECYRDISFKLGLWFASFYLTLEDVLPKRFGWPRHISADGGCDGPYVSIDLHHAGDDCFDCKGWKGKHWYWWPLNTLLGKPAYTSKPLTEEPSHRRVLMPEATYPVTVTLTEDSWKRPRWPWPTIMRRAQIDCPGGIPKPGKGENTWDCGEDATYGLTCPAATVEEALVKLERRVVEDRERYGGKNWLPEKAREQVMR